MNPDQFRELCRGTCRQLGESDTDALLEGAGVLIDGVRLGVFHKDEVDEAGVYCYADLGEIETQVDAARVMEELMALNLELDVGHNEVIGLERETRHLVLRARVCGEDETVHEGQLADRLTYYAGMANGLFDTVLGGVARPD
jgi:hypothetical protein